MVKRTVFFVSDRTGITVQMLGQSILSQFHDVAFTQTTLPFVDSIELATEAAEQIRREAQNNGERAIVFSTLIDPKLAEIISGSGALYLDCLGTFIAPLEEELGVPSSHTIGVTHSVNDYMNYHQRMEAVNFSLAHDDGLAVADLSTADVVLIGVSRCGKTPTCLYLALQFGIRAANYPLTPDDLERLGLPESLAACREKIYGLTIDPQRLHQIRSERRANSEYSALKNCVSEIREAERIMRHEQILVLDTTTKSIEELSTLILQKANLKRQIF